MFHTCCSTPGCYEIKDLREDEDGFENNYYCGKCWAEWSREQPEQPAFEFKEINSPLAKTFFNWHVIDGDGDVKFFEFNTVTLPRPASANSPRLFGDISDLSSEDDEPEQDEAGQEEAFVSEKNALISFRDAMHCENWLHSRKGWEELENYSRPSELSKCEGVTCSRGRVTKIDLRACNLEGELPPSIASLQHLKVLNLASNAIGGSICEELGSLGKLREAYLSCNRLVGALPRSLGRMTSLAKLFLGKNKLEGSVPWAAIESLVQQHSLRKLYLGGNCFDEGLNEDTVIEAVGAMVKLQAIDLTGLVAFKSESSLRATARASKRDASRELLQSALPSCTTVYA